MRYYMQERYSEFCTSAITESIGDSKALWSTVNGLLKMPVTSTTLKYTADEFAAHFRKKVDDIREATRSAPAATVQP